MIRHLCSDDAEAYVALRHEALVDTPTAFAASPEDDLAGSVDQVRAYLAKAPEAVIIGAFQPHLVGNIGIHRERQLKAIHKAQIWGFYVTPEHRHHGLGTELLRAALLHARTLPGVEWIHLSVSATTPGAQRLYEHAGFQVWGTEPDALRHAGHSIAEHHLAVHLDVESDA